MSARPPNDSDGKAAADDLAERREVGPCGLLAQAAKFVFVQHLGAAGREPEPGHHLVEDEQSAVFPGEFAEAAQEGGARQDRPSVADHGLENDAGDLVGVGFERGFDRTEVVIGERERVHRGLRRHSGRTGDAEGSHAGAGFDEQRVRVAVVAALELDDERSPGESAREADGGHASLGPGADEPELLDGRKTLLHEFGEVAFRGGAGAEGGGAAGGLTDGLDCGRKGVAQEHGAPGAEEVDVAVAVGVGQEGAFGTGDEGRMAAHGAKCANRRINTAGQKALRAGLELGGTGERKSHESSIGRASEGAPV